MNADKWTDKALMKLEKRINREYTIAGAELKRKADEYFEAYKTRWEKEWKAYKRGEYTKAEFQAWEVAQMGRGERWNLMTAQMVNRMAKSQIIAQGYANGILPSVYVNNNNAIAKIAQASAMEQGITGISFELVDEYTVKRLMTDSSEVLPYKKIALNLPKANGWNRNNIQNALLQGILQGDAIDAIADRFERVADMNRVQSVRSARTAVTGAQSAGKQDRYNSLAEQGCIMTKIWVATNDERTREEHAEANGQEVDYDQPFEVGGEELMYPADSAGSGWNIYNCRCTMRTGAIRFKSMLDEETRAKANIRVY